MTKTVKKEKRYQIEPQWIVVPKYQVTRTKYNVEKETAKRTYKGVVYDSVMEMRYYIEVVEPLLESGYIVQCDRQVPYVLMEGFVRHGKKVQPIKYVADYYLKYSNGIEEVIDIKGKPDAVAKLKRKLFWRLYPDVNYTWVTYSKAYGGWVDYDEVQRLKKEKKKAAEKEERK